MLFSHASSNLLPAISPIFSSAFSKLLPYIRHLEELKLAKLQAVLEAQLEKSGQPVEIWGWRVHSQLLGAVGIWLVIAIQLYFFVHLRELLSKMHQGGTTLDEPWIGLYLQFRTSTLAYYTSIAAIPAFFALYSGWLEFKDPFSGFASYLRCLGVVISILLTWRIWYLSKRFRRQVGGRIRTLIVEE